MWDADRLSFVEPLAEMIRSERAAGRAPDGPDPVALATVLLELNDRALERVVRGGTISIDDQVEAVTTIWLRTIYGTVGMSAPMKYDEVAFPSAGVECSGWHFTGQGEALATAAGRPVVVMAHGLGGTKDSGLAPFAEALADAGARRARLRLPRLRREWRQPRARRCG